MYIWIRKTLSGSLICIFCGSLVTQVLGIWFCSDPHCVKHTDIPVEAQKGFTGWIHTKSALGTVSLASGSADRIGTIKKGGEV